MRILSKYFSPVPHQLVRDGHLSRIQAPAASLYLFLICVGDKSGVSYYSDSAVRQRVNVANIQQAREELINADLIAYDKPLYQVLSLPAPAQTEARPAIQSAAIQSAAMPVSAKPIANIAENLRLKNDFNEHLQQYLNRIDGGRL